MFPRPLLYLAIATALGVGTALTGCSESTTVTVVKSSASAWVRVAPEMQPQLIDELKEYAQQRSLSFAQSVTEYPWRMIEIELKTPQGNEILVINATAIDKFSAGITVFQDAEDWRRYWNDFRAHVSARHMWEDVP